MSNFFRPYVGDTKLVIAFDIGTAFSGISYCILEQGVVPEILGVTQFPGQTQAGSDAKVPSLLYYDKSGRVRAAGAEAVTEGTIEAAMIEEWTKAEWWKLHLCPNHLAATTHKEADLPPLPPGKTAVQVLTDFIRYLLWCIEAYIEERHVAVSWSSLQGSIEYVFTRPNGWDGMHQQLYRRAIELAGLVPGTPDGQSRVHMLTEGEASLHFCVANLVNVEPTNHAAPQGVAIIDAGGGTIDLSMFRITSNPVACEEIAPAECRLQGSVFVTNRARVLLERKLEGWEHPNAEEIAEFTREFDQTTKLVIKSDQELAYTRVASRRYTNSKYGISFGKLKWTGQEATGLFDDSIGAIIEAFEEQQESFEVPITLAFLVGGLSTNPWLWSRLQSYFKRKNVEICRPDNHINKAVANGAVLSRVDPNNPRVVSRVAGATYGLVCSVPANKHDAEHVSRESQWERDPTEECYVPDRFEMKLLKGDKVTEGMELRESFSLTEDDRTDFSTQIVRLECYRGNLCDPKWVDEDPSAFFPFCSICADLSQAVNDLIEKRTPSGQICYQLDYDVIVCFGLNEIQAYLGWKAQEGEHRIQAVVSFEESVSHVNDEELRQPRKARQSETSENGPQSLPGGWHAKITSLRTANEMLRRDFAVASTQIEELKQQSHELDASKKELKSKALLIEEKDRCIAAFAAQVVELQRSDAEKAKQATIARQEYDKLQKDYSSHAAELQKCCDSVQSELQASKALVEEKDRTIASLSVHIERSKLADAIKTEQLHAEEKEKLQQDIASLSSQINNLQVCCDVRSKEVVSLRKEVRTKATLLAEKEHAIASLAVERDLARREDAVKTGLVATARRDADLLWQKLSEAWDQNADLEQRFDSQLVELDNLHTELSRVKAWAREQVADVSEGEVAAYVARALEEKEGRMEELGHALAAALSRNDDLQKSQEALLSKLSALSDELVVKTSQCEGSEDAIASLTVQVNQLRVADADKTDRLVTALDQLRALQLEVTTATAQFIDVQDRHVIQSKEIIYVNNRLRSMTLYAEETDRTILHLSTQCDQHAERTAKLQQELSVSNSQVTELQKRYEELSEELTSVRSELESRKLPKSPIQDKTVVPKNRVEESTHENALNDERIADAHKQIEGLQQALYSSYSQFDVLKHDNEIKSTELDTLRKQLSIMEVEDRTAISPLEIEELKRKHGVAMHELDLARNTIEQLHRNSDLSSQESVTRESDFSDSLEDMAKLRTCCATLTEERDSAWNELRESKGLIESKDRTITSLNSAVAKLKDYNGSATQQLVAERQEKEKLQSQLAGSTSKIADLQECCDVQSKEIVSLLDEHEIKATLLADQEYTITSVTAEYDRARREIAMKVDLVAHMSQEAEQVQLTLAALQEENEKLRKHFDGQLTEFNKLRNELDRLKNNRSKTSDGNVADDMRRALKEKEKLIGELSSRVNALDEELRVKTSLAETAQGTINSLTVQVGQLEALVTEKTEQLEAANNGAQELRVELHTCLVRLEGLQARFDKRSKEFSIQNKQLSTLTYAIQEKDRLIPSLTAERDELVQQVEELKEELSVVSSQLIEHRASHQKQSGESRSVRVLSRYSVLEQKLTSQQRRHAR